MTSCAFAASLYFCEQSHPSWLAYALHACCSLNVPPHPSQSCSQLNDNGGRSRVGAGHGCIHRLLLCSNAQPKRAHCKSFSLLQVERKLKSEASQMVPAADGGSSRPGWCSKMLPTLRKVLLTWIYRFPQGMSYVKPIDRSPRSGSYFTAYFWRPCRWVLDTAISSSCTCNV